MDPFATLGIERRFDVDLDRAEKTHRELSRALHPDKYASAPPSERRSSLAKAVEVNEAWRIVRDPIRRAESLFALAGVAIDETSEPKASPALLMDAMELREELAEAKARRDLKAIETLVGRVDEKKRAVEDRLRTGLASTDRASLEALLPALGELRFHQRFLDEVSAIEDELAEAAVQGI
jgi:molecular chaperone HscB